MMKYEWDADTLKRLRDAGMGAHRIAKIYGCDPSTVRFWLRKAGLPTRVDWTKRGRDRHLEKIVREARI